MIERAHVFGSHQGLVGVLCEPAGGPRPGRPVVVCANVGLNHRVGPNRAWVELARSLAAAGYATLRFDLSGLGDSEPRRDARSDSERAVLDLREALDFLEHKRGLGRFVLVANCSGVDGQHVLTREDPRVVGAVAIDGYAYRTPGFHLRRVLRLAQPSRWRRFFRRRRILARARRETGEVREVWTRDLPTREQFAADLERILGRGVRLLLIFTSGADLRYNHRGQFHAGFGRREAVEVEFHPQADHLFSRQADREALLRQVRAFLDRHFGDAAAGAPAASPEVSA